jgi:predicted branched-subunit amino acid permease
MDASPFHTGPAAYFARRGVGDALGVPSLVLVATMLGIGGLAHDTGFPIGATVLSTVVIWAGPAQVILFGSIATGMALPAIALAICFSSLRFLPMTVSLLPLMRLPEHRRWQLLLAGHLVAVTNWTEGMRRLPPLPMRGRYPYFIAFGLTTLSTSALATAAGFMLASKLPGVLAAALLFITPLFFSASLAAGARRLVDWAAILLGFSLAPAAAYLLGPQFDILTGGLLGGTLAFGLHALRRRWAR